MSIAQCSKCLDVLESTHRHDFVRCECGNSFLDGGDDYFRGGGSLVAYVKDYTITDKKYFNSGREHERERIKNILDTSRDCECDDRCITDVNIYAFVLEELGIDLFNLIDGETDD
jgi:hypothetical protein